MPQNEPIHRFTYEDIHKTVADLANQVQRGDFKPTVIVAIGTGGFIPARIMKTYLKLPILTVGLAFYTEDNKTLSAPQKIQWIDEAEKKLRGQRVLLIDEVDDSRSTLAYCVRELFRHQPEAIAVAVLHNKNKKKKDEFPSELTAYWCGQLLADEWCVYPWDALDIDEHTKRSQENVTGK